MLNEVSQMHELCTHLQFFQEAGCEIIFADGGSVDGSSDIAQTRGFKIIHSARGRARQMNVGAATAGGDFLLFLHADTRLPLDAMQIIERALAQGTHYWGRFNVRITGHSLMLRVIGHLINIRSRLTGIATGDQAIFVQRHLFDQVLGYSDQPLMEDIELCKQLLRYSRPACIAQCVSTSGRRWESRGVWRTILLMWRLRLDYWRGVDVAMLARMYK